MKKFISILVLLCTVACMFSIDAAAQKKQKKDDVEKYAVKHHATTGFGTATHFNESTARNIAEMNARAAFGRKLETAVYTSLEVALVSKTETVATTGSSQFIAEGIENVKEMTSSISSQVIRNVHVKKSRVYLLENNTYKVNVVVEFLGTPDQMFTGFADVLQRHMERQGNTNVEVRLEEARKVFTATMEQN
jgi:hypothetical protein